MSDLVQRLRQWGATDTRADIIDRMRMAADRIEALELELGRARLCLTCGKVRDASIPRQEPACEPVPEHGHLCLFDATPQEAWHHWSQIAHERRVRIEADEALLRMARDALRRAVEVKPGWVPDWEDAIAALTARLEPTPAAHPPQS